MSAETYELREEWRSIPTLPDYEASSLGRIRRATPGVGTYPGFVLKPKDICGYKSIRLMDNGKARTKRVARLVLAAFTGFMPSVRMDCNHINGIRNDDRPENLEWVTRSQNQLHAVLFGKLKPPIMRGEDCSSAKLTRAQVEELKRRVQGGESRKKLARELGLSDSTIGRAVSGKSWK